MHSFLDHVPDIPRWVEARSLLLSGRCKISGSPGNFVIVSTDSPLMCVVGQPEFVQLTNIVDGTAVLAAPENASFVSGRLPGWKQEPAILHQLPSDIQWEKAQYEKMRLIGTGDIPAEITPELLSELHQAMQYGPVAANFEGEKAVSFCYAAWVTETLWDISIDTLPVYRGKGLALAPVQFMINFMRKQKKEPVWGSMQSNIASLRLAKKLGFVEVDRLAVFTK